MKQSPKPDWDFWKHVAKLTHEEAAALTLNICPNTVKTIRAEVEYSGSPTLFPLVAGAYGMFETASEFEKRLFLLQRSDRAELAFTELAPLADGFGWEIPDELCALSPGRRGLVASAAEVVVSPAATDVMRESERVKLLKQIGGMALLLAEKSSLYKRGNQRPNADQIAKAVVDVVADLPNHKGVGNTSLRTSIQQGIELLTD